MYKRTATQTHTAPGVSCCVCLHPPCPLSYFSTVLSSSAWTVTCLRLGVLMCDITDVAFRCYTDTLYFSYSTADCWRYLRRLFICYTYSHVLTFTGKLHAVRKCDLLLGASSDISGQCNTDTWTCWAHECMLYFSEVFLLFLFFLKNVGLKHLIQYSRLLHVNPKSIHSYGNVHDVGCVLKTPPSISLHWVPGPYSMSVIIALLW